MKRLMMMAVLAVALCALAEDLKPEGRFDVDGTKDGITLKAEELSPGGWTGNASWMDATKSKQFAMVTFPAGAEWKNGSFSFTPDKDGIVTVFLRSRWVDKGKTAPWTLFDDITVEGSDLKNGDFEKDSPDWIMSGEGDNKASIVGKGHSSTYAIMVSHDSFASQTMKVKAGNKVKVSYWYKSAE
ncbi:MAG TPA: hypothetical protein DCZ94_18075 [Lentisphaeria bacterium]|nr:MAG: hypothetical protein A2X48_00730 [Lentisphaerae bacterium GWF2_49_21]HBC88854.1 hypothetical protein [Lentisphaeria bacterium]